MPPPPPHARASAKKFRKVNLTISPKGIIITDTETQEVIENVSIYSSHARTAPNPPHPTSPAPPNPHPPAAPKRPPPP
ncbi:unnamed protein product [Coregonus sp. 'balchen']|nr:unnamed protein product [Coregonus sp. 'balchen']